MRTPSQKSAIAPTATPLALLKGGFSRVSEGIPPGPAALAACLRSGLGLKKRYNSSLTSGHIHLSSHITTNSTPKLAAMGETRKNYHVHVHAKNNASAPIWEWSSKTDKLFDIICTQENLIAAWQELKSNPGMMTPGEGVETLDGINLAWFEKASENLKKGTYMYPKRRRTYISKKNTEEKRPLTISNPRTKIIEKAILNVIEPYFEGMWKWISISEEEYNSAKLESSTALRFGKEYKQTKEGKFRKEWTIPPQFSPSSFGFRKERSAHGALQSIKNWRSSTVWFIDYDLRKAFDKVNHARLENIFKKTIKDPRIWTEIQKMLNTGIIDINTIYQDKGVGQGSVLSPFLFNVYMNELDQYIKHLIVQVEKPYDLNKQNKSEASRAYKTMMAQFSTGRIHTAIKKYGSVEAMKKALVQRKKEHYDKYGRARGIDLEARHIQYVRYADDMLLGIVGPKQFTEKIREQINLFIKSNLHLEIKKDKIVNRNESGITFLGFNIYLAKFNKKTRTLWSATRAAAKYKRRIQARLRMLDAKQAHTAVYAVKKMLLSTYRKNLENNGLSWKKEKDRIKATKLTLEVIGAESADQSTMGESSNPKEKSTQLKRRNEAFRRWEKHFNNLLEGNLTSILNHAYDNVSDIDPDNSADLETIKKIQQLKEKFLKGINELQEKHKTKVKEERSAKAIELFKKNNAKNLNNVSPETMDDLKKAAHVLANEQLSQERVRRVSISAPLKDLINKLREKGFYHPKTNRPTANILLKTHSDADIISAYSALMYGLLNWYRCADNFPKVKSIISVLRKSCLFTLAGKHNKIKAWAYNVFGDDVSLTLAHGHKVGLPPRKLVSQMGQKFQIKDGPKEVFNIDKLIIAHSNRMHIGKHYFERCSVVDCKETQIEVHHIRKLQRSKGNPETIITTSNKRVSGIAKMLSAINRKQIPLCPKHHREFDNNKESPIDWEYLKNISKVKPG